jgi:hypothetical protein
MTPSRFFDLQSAVSGADTKSPGLDFSLAQTALDPVWLTLQASQQSPLHRHGMPKDIVVGFTRHENYIKVAF